MAIRTIFLFASTVLILGYTSSLHAQLLDEEAINPHGVVISKTHLQFHADVGKPQSQSVVISNNSTQKQQFRVVYKDFEILENGDSRLSEAGSTAQSLSRLLEISPESFEVDPGKTAEVMLTVDVDKNPLSVGPAWGIVMIEPVVSENDPEKIYAEQNLSDEGLLSTLAFGVWMHQNPKGSDDQRVDITNFIIGNKIKNKGIFLKVKNKGDGISYCNAYVEITNLTTGEQILIEGKQYSLLPGSRTTFMFELANSLPKGSYSALGVLDYDNESDLVATELQFRID